MISIKLQTVESKRKLENKRANIFTRDATFDTCELANDSDEIKRSVESYVGPVDDLSFDADTGYLSFTPVLINNVEIECVQRMIASRSRFNSLLKKTTSIQKNVMSFSDDDVGLCEVKRYLKIDPTSIEIDV